MILDKYENDVKENKNKNIINNELKLDSFDDNMMHVMKLMKLTNWSNWWI